jgi:predicted TIM-barrel fold metal-dependent hydrolase
MKSKEHNVKTKNTIDNTKEKQKKRFRVIDAHLHVMNTNLNLPTHFLGIKRTSATVEKTLEAMDKGGVDKAILITYTSVDIAKALRFDPVKSLPVYSKEYSVAACKKYPDRFYWFTDHVDPSRKGYLDDLKRDLDNGAKGVKILSAFHGFLPDNKGFMRVYELCRERKKPVIIDGYYWAFESMPPNKESAERRKAARSIEGYAACLEKIFQAFPTVPFSLAHAGTVAHVSQYPVIYKLIKEHPNVYCDFGMAVGFSDQWLASLVRAVGPERVMYGTDWPYWSSDGSNSYLTGSFRHSLITQISALSNKDKQLILAGNAERFVKFLLPIDRSGARKAEGNRKTI